MLVNLGRQNGVDSGFAVINSEGFIGRTINTGNRTSRILLLTDTTSRVPVTVGKEALRAVAIGNGSMFPEIGFLSRSVSIYEGDLVFTSGHGGDLPKGLAIGVVKKIGDKYHIATRARHEGTDYVSILYFEQPGLARRP
jgi:rod shape-determining protein MreC